MRKSLLTAAVIAAIVPAAKANTPASHWCRRGDPPLLASAATTCQFAGQIITAYVNVCHEARHCHLNLAVPGSRVRYGIRCRRTGTHRSGLVYCRAPARTDIWARFSAVI